MFYVYEYYKVANGEVFYVGKGTGRRKDELHNRSAYFMAVYNKYECAVRIVYDGLTNEEACRLEVERIAEMRSKGQAYCNFTNGGTGFSTGELNPIHKRIEEGTFRAFGRDLNPVTRGFEGRNHTEEAKALISRNRKGKGARYGKDNPMYGRGFKGSENPMYGRTGELHPNSTMYEVTYLDGSTETLTAKQCEKKFGIAFDRVRGVGGTLHYKKKSKNDIYEGTVLRVNL